MKVLGWIYPIIVGLLLGFLQTGLFFQLSFTLSSSFRIFLMVTVCWLLGSAIGVQLAKQTKLPLNGFLMLALLAYLACVVLLQLAPFNTQLWPIYGAFIALSGLYPGVFFVRANAYYRARELFFRENNGFILGLVCSTLLFLIVGRVVLWFIPLLIAGGVAVCSHFATQSKLSLSKQAQA